MTLCISYRHYQDEKHSQSIAITDSRLTTSKRKTKLQSNDSSESAKTFIPSNIEIVHQSDTGIKLHIIKSLNSAHQRDIVVSIAGSVSLGIQSVIHLESALRGITKYVNYDSLLKIIDVTIEKFWENAHDKEVEYLFMIPDDEGRSRILRKHRNFSFEEIPPIHDIIVGVIGDNSKLIKERIIGDINRIITAKKEIPLYVATEVACIRAMRKEIEDEDNKLVGGAMQMGILEGNTADYYRVNYKGINYFRGISYGELIDLNTFPFYYRPWSIGVDLFDPEKDILNILDQIQL